MVIRFLLWVGPILATVTAAQAQPLSTWMLDSIIARQDGITSTGAMTRQIEKVSFHSGMTPYMQPLLICVGYLSRSAARRHQPLR